MSTKNSSTIALKEVSTVYITREQGKALSSPQTVAKTFDWLKNETREKFIAVHLNTKNQIISFETVSIGSLSAAIVSPREVFKAAILSNAASIILIHNHPSGDTMPSREDITLTKRLADTGKLLDIEVIDHVIIGDDKHTSLKEQGHLGNAR